MRPKVRLLIEYLNKELQNAEVLGLELKCYGEDKKSLVLVPRLVGQTQATSHSLASGNTLWTPDKLEKAYKDFEDQKLSQKLLNVLDWALKNRIFQEARTQKPNFTIQGRNKLRIVSFFSNGSIYLAINAKHYADGEKQRDELLNAIKKMQLIDQDIDPKEVISGRNLKVLLRDLDQSRLDAFLDLLKRFCV